MNREKILYILGIGILLGVTGCGWKKEDVVKPSEVIIDGSYKIEGVDNMEFLFSKESTLEMNQRGIYEMVSDEEGEPVVRLCFDDTTRELPEDYNYLDYKVTKRGKVLELTYIPKEDTVEVKPMELLLLDGKDGLTGTKKFNGSYQIGIDGDSYRYIFTKDGIVNMQVNEYYYADETTLTLYDHVGTTDYFYQQDGDTFTLRNKQGEVIFELVKQKN